MSDQKTSTSGLFYTTSFPDHGEPSAFDLRAGESPIIIIAPHAGWRVPGKMYDEHGKPLGLEDYMFDPSHPGRRHEACDWGTAELMDELAGEESISSASMMEANYSRLLVDLNRAPEVWLTAKLDELGSAVPRNHSLTKVDTDWRESNLYNPWFDTLNHLIGQARQRHGFALVLDIHSFTPVFNGVPRNVEIGSISLADTPQTLKIDAIVRQRAAEIGFTYTPNAPYTLRTGADVRRRYATERISFTFNAHYHGLEIRNNLLETPEGCRKLSNAIALTVKDILDDPPLEHEPSV